MYARTTSESGKYARARDYVRVHMALRNTSFYLIFRFKVKLFVFLYRYTRLTFVDTFCGKGGKNKKDPIKHGSLLLLRQASNPAKIRIYRPEPVFPRKSLSLVLFCLALIANSSQFYGLSYPGKSIVAAPECWCVMFPRVGTLQFFSQPSAGLRGSDS